VPGGTGYTAGMTEAAQGFLLGDLAIVMIVAGIVTLSFHRLRQPVVLGYILAGVIIGPHTPPFPLIKDEASIQTLADLGVIFLMFSLGLQFSLRTLRQVGRTAFIASLVEVMTMLWAGYELGRLFGWSKMDSVFLGAMLAITSTTIIVKTLTDLGLIKAKFAALITGISIVEDIIGIAITALLSGIAMTGQLQFHEIAGSAGRIVVFLAVVLVGGLIFVPPVLRYVARFKSDEMLLVTAVGLCFGVALVALRLGYSVALGAFLIGTIIGETREAGKIKVLTEPLRDIFSAVFFVAIGMLIDPALIVQFGGPILVIALVVVVGKLLAFSFGTFVAGHELRTALRVGTSMIPLGELSFVIAALGLSLNVTSDFLYPIVVSVSAVTMLLSPYLIRHSDSIIAQFDRAAPRWLVDSLELYSRWAQRRAAAQQDNLARQLARKWIWQMGLNVALVTGIFFAAAAVAERAARWWPQLPGWIGGAKGLLWIGAGAVALPSLIATIRKLQAFAMLVAETKVTTRAAGKNTALIRGVITNVILVAGTAVLGLWVLVVSAPFLPPSPGLLVPVVVMALMTALLWRFFIKIHAKAQFALHETLSESPPLPEAADQPLGTILRNAQLEMVTVARQSPAAGRLIRELELRSKTGASIVAIERDGDNLINPDANEELRPGDRLFLLGTAEQIAAARALLSR
jgi:CPA2 family monovalent cation:H+ antiporter-2